MLLWAWVALRRWKIAEVLSQLQQSARPQEVPDAPEPIVRAVQRATHLHIMPMLCLPQSLAIARMLARRGQPCELLIGARPGQGTLDAHAWVELNGHPINSPPNTPQTHPVLLRQAIKASQ